MWLFQNIARILSKWLLSTLPSISAWFKPKQYINGVSVTGSVQSHSPVTISAKAFTDCIITGLLLIYKYQPPPNCFSLSPRHFLLSLSPLYIHHCLPSILSFLVCCLETPFTSPLFALGWKGRKGMSHRLRYVNNRWLMDLGYAQIPILLIWQSSDGINIEGGKGSGGVNNSSLFCALQDYKWSCNSFVCHKISINSWLRFNHIHLSLSYELIRGRCGFGLWALWSMHSQGVGVPLREGKL